MAKSEIDSSFKILNHLRAAGWDFSKDSKADKGLQEVLNAGGRAKNPVTQILTFGRESTSERKPVNIGAIVKETINLLRPSLPSTIEIRMHIETSSDVIEMNPMQIHHVLMNLCTNAAYAMRENGGILEITLTKIDIKESSTAQYPDLDPGTYFKLSVSDTGHGIPPELLKRIFEPYFATKPATEGRGLGLALVHGIVKSYEGEIEVFSEPGKGTTFSIYLPGTNDSFS
jgi:signal transduction histidine kinase